MGSNCPTTSKQTHQKSNKSLLSKKTKTSEITQQIDCTLCGNCCSQLQPELHEKDIATLAHLENTTTENYTNNYCEKNESEEIFLKAKPCHYLKEKKFQKS